MRKTLFPCLFIICQIAIDCYSLNAQCTDCSAGGHQHPHGHMDALTASSKIHGSLNQSYLLENVCGLNYAQATVLTETRTARSGFNFGGTAFPSTIPLITLPFSGVTIVKAFLYYGCTYTEFAAPATTATVTNPLLNTATIPSTLVGTTTDNICWPGNGSATYRADITSLISGPGNYIVNLNGFDSARYEVDGATILVMYIDSTAGYTGSIALYDGDLSNNSGLDESYTAKNFTVCSPTSNATAFTLLADVQQDVMGGVNTEKYNGDSVVFPNLFWNYCSIPTGLTATQDTLQFNTYTNNTQDCYFIALTGLYWQNTGCITCTSIPTTMTLTIAAKPDTCINDGTATVTVAGAAGPLTYLWGPGFQTTATVTGLAPGIYTVDVSDGHTYAFANVTVGYVGMNLAVSTVSQNCTTPGSASVKTIGGFPPFSYLWTPMGQTTDTATGLTSGTYTVSVTDSIGCTKTITATVGNITPIAIDTSVTHPVTCPYTPGYISTLESGGTSPYTYLWAPGGQTTANISGVSAGTYTLTVTDHVGCIAYSTVDVKARLSYISLTTLPFGYYCPYYMGGANVIVTGGDYPYTYLWTPGGQTTQYASNLTLGTYTVTVTDSMGCMQMAKATITQIPMIVTATATPDTIAPGDSTSLYATFPITPSSFKWSPTFRVRLPNSFQTWAKPLVTTVYTVTAHDSCGTFEDSVKVYVTTCPNTFDEPICVATVDPATNYVDVIWGRTNSPPQNGYGYYNIYRDTVTGYVFYHTQPLNISSILIDENSNPSAGPVSYELSTVDSCGESALSPPATTIYLVVTPGTNANILNWTAYVGFTPSRYRILRGPSMSSLVQIDSVSSLTLAYTDSFPPPGSFYAVVAVDPSVCLPSTSIKTRTGSFVPFSGSYSNGFNTIIFGEQTIGNTVSNLSIYPNPSNRILNVNYSMNISGQIRISIMDELGQIVYDNTETKNAGNYKEQLNLENLSSGIYTLRMLTDGGSTVKKLVIMKK